MLESEWIPEWIPNPTAPTDIPASTTLDVAERIEPLLWIDWSIEVLTGIPLFKFFSRSFWSTVSGLLLRLRDLLVLSTVTWDFGRITIGSSNDTFLAPLPWVDEWSFFKINVTGPLAFVTLLSLSLIKFGLFPSVALLPLPLAPGLLPETVRRRRSSSSFFKINVTAPLAFVTLLSLSLIKFGLFPSVALLPLPLAPGLLPETVRRRISSSSVSGKNPRSSSSILRSNESLPLVLLLISTPGILSWSLIRYRIVSCCCYCCCYCCCC